MYPYNEIDKTYRRRTKRQDDAPYVNGPIYDETFQKVNTDKREYKFQNGQFGGYSSLWQRNKPIYGPRFQEQREFESGIHDIRNPNINLSGDQFINMRRERNDSKWGGLSLTDSIVKFYENPSLLSKELSLWSDRISKMKTLVTPVKNLVESVDNLFKSWNSENNH